MARISEFIDFLAFWMLENADLSQKATQFYALMRPKVLKAAIRVGTGLSLILIGIGTYQ